MAIRFDDDLRVVGSVRPEATGAGAAGDNVHSDPEEKAGLTVHVSVSGPDGLLKRVNPTLVALIQSAAQTMVEKNTKRGDAWRHTGVMGNFIDVHTCYMRLRHLVWERPISFDDADWVADTSNALLDLRNYTLLIELAMAHKLAAGEPVAPLQ